MNDSIAKQGFIPARAAINPDLAMVINDDSKWSHVHKFGTHQSVGVTYETIWENGGLVPYLSAAAAMEVVSGEAVDNETGTGARTVKITYLDASFNEQTETVTLDGLTPVAMVGVPIRVYRAYVVTAGTGLVNAGDITVRLASAGATHTTITAGKGQTLQAFYTVPAGYTGYIMGIDYSIGSGKQVNIALFTRNFGEAWRVRDEQYLYQAPFQLDALIATVPEKSDIEVRALADVAGVAVGATFHVYLMKN